MADYSLGSSHLSRKTKIGYGLGHILNDCCACMWFTYLLVYLQYVLRVSKDNLNIYNLTIGFDCFWKVQQN